MARHCGSKHHELVVYKPMLWPGWNRASVPSACRGPVPSIRAVAAERIKLALSGLGADEFSVGYPSHRLMPWLQCLSWCPSSLRQSLLQELSPQAACKLSVVPR